MSLSASQACWALMKLGLAMIKALNPVIRPFRSRISSLLPVMLLIAGTYCSIVCWEPDGKGPKERSRTEYARVMLDSIPRRKQNDQSASEDRDERPLLAEACPQP